MSKLECDNCRWRLRWVGGVRRETRIPDGRRIHSKKNCQHTATKLLSFKADVMFTRVACRAMFAKVENNCVGFAEQLKQAFMRSDIKKILMYGLSHVERYHDSRQIEKGADTVRILNRVIKFPHVRKGILKKDQFKDENTKFAACIAKTNGDENLFNAAQMMKSLPEDCAYDVLDCFYQLAQQNAYAKAVFTNTIFYGVQTYFVIPVDDESENADNESKNADNESENAANERENTILRFLYDFFPKKDTDSKCKQVNPLNLLPENIMGYMLKWCDYYDVWNLALTSKLVFCMCNDNGQPGWKAKKNNTLLRKAFISCHFKMPGKYRLLSRDELGETFDELSEQQKNKFKELHENNINYETTIPDIKRWLRFVPINCSHFPWYKLSHAQVWTSKNLERFAQAAEYIKRNKDQYIALSESLARFDTKVSFIFSFSCTFCAILNQTVHIRIYFQKHVQFFYFFFTGIAIGQLSI